ncbi:MAG: DUF4058 family protein [Pirellulaceae bacterium]
MPAHDWTRVEDGIFHSFHLSWIAQLYERLNGGLLPEGYYALAEQCAGETIPDLLTLHSRGPEPAETDSFSTTGSSNMLLLEEAPPRVAIVTELDADAYVHKRRTLVIRHVSDDSVVALVEIVSAGNKSSRHAFEQFLDKILAALDQGLHLLIIDLHPPTARDPQGIHAAIAEALGSQVTGLDPAKPLTQVSYLARSGRRGYAQPLAVGDALTEMPLFLRKDRYVNVPLEETYSSAFASVPKHLRAILERSS